MKPFELVPGLFSQGIVRVPPNKKLPRVRRTALAREFVFLLDGDLRIARRWHGFAAAGLKGSVWRDGVGIATLLFPITGKPRSKVIIVAAANVMPIPGIARSSYRSTPPLRLRYEVSACLVILSTMVLPRLGSRQSPPITQPRSGPK